MRKQLAFALTVLSLTAHSAAASPYGSRFEDVSSSHRTQEDHPAPALFSQDAIDQEVAAARRWLELGLVDYESARFSEVRIVLVSADRRNPRNVVLAVCGLVNSRNRMGGYTGFRPFWFGSGLPAAFQSGVGGLATDVCGPARSIAPTDYSEQLSPGASR